MENERYSVSKITNMLQIVTKIAADVTFTQKRWIYALAISYVDAMGMLPLF